MLLFCSMGKDIGRFNMNYWSKLSTDTLKKPVLSYSDSHTPPASNLTRKYILSRLDNKHVITNQNKNGSSNTDDIQECVTKWKKITVFRSHLQPLIWFHWMLHRILHLLSYIKLLNYPPLVKKIVFQINKKISQAGKCVKYHIHPIFANVNWCYLSWLSGLYFLVCICLNHFFIVSWYIFYPT